MEEGLAGERECQTVTHITACNVRAVWEFRFTVRLMNCFLHGSSSTHQSTDFFFINNVFYIIAIDMHIL